MALQCDKRARRVPPHIMPKRKKYTRIFAKRLTLVAYLASVLHEVQESVPIAQVVAQKSLRGAAERE